jgi:hypothetical protein
VIEFANLANLAARSLLKGHPWGDRGFQFQPCV